jgi:hypothetical protein
MAVFRVRPTGYRYPVGLNDLGNFTGTVEYLVVAGGGGGGFDRGGGGGAGGYLCGVSGENTGGGNPAQPAATFVASQTYTVTVGSGGPFSGGPTSARAANGSFSLITNASPGSNTTYLYAVGGGGAGSQSVTGHLGGSGGGNGSTATTPGGAGTPNQGYVGGSGQPVEAGTYNRQGGGGG